MAQSNYNEPDMDERTKYVREYDRERRKRAKRLFHWSLGMPPDEDDVNVQANRSYGITWKEVAAAGALALAGYGIFRQPSTPPPPPQPPAVQEVEPLKGTIRFWTEDGTEIEQATE
jgi:hypothetical protein